MTVLKENVLIICKWNTNDGHTMRGSDYLHSVCNIPNCPGAVTQRHIRAAFSAKTRDEEKMNVIQAECMKSKWFVTEVSTKVFLCLLSKAGKRSKGCRQRLKPDLRKLQECGNKCKMQLFPKKPLTSNVWVDVRKTSLVLTGWEKGSTWRQPYYKIRT